MLRPTDITRAETHFLHDAFFRSISRALGFPPYLYVGVQFVKAIDSNGKIVTYRLPEIAQRWKVQADLGEPLKPLIFNLLPVEDGD